MWEIFKNVLKSNFKISMIEVIEIFIADSIIFSFLIVFLLNSHPSSERLIYFLPTFQTDFPLLFLRQSEWKNENFTHVDERSKKLILTFPLNSIFPAALLLQTINENLIEMWSKQIDLNVANKKSINLSKGGWISHPSKH